MPQCPQCTKPLREFTRRCPTCQADLDLLVDYVSHLQSGLERAEHFTRVGELGQAFWAYLEVLEVDPDNPVARRQIGQVVTAVRQFDRVSPGRRWVDGTTDKSGKTGLDAYLSWLLLAALLIVAFSIGYAVGSYVPAEPQEQKEQQEQKERKDEPREPRKLPPQLGLPAV
jgi:hypothetical protein